MEILIYTAAIYIIFKSPAQEVVMNLPFFFSSLHDLSTRFPREYMLFVIISNDEEKLSTPPSLPLYYIVAILIGSLLPF